MNKLYDDWLLAKNELSKFKSLELELRNKIIDSLIKDEVSGNIKFTQVPYNVTVGLSLRKILDEAILDTIYDNLSDKEKNCISHKPGLIAKELKELTGHEALFEAITVKPSQATLKIEIKDE